MMSAVLKVFGHSRTTMRLIRIPDRDMWSDELLVVLLYVFLTLERSIKEPGYHSFLLW